MKFTAEQIQKATGGRILQSGPASFDLFGIDSRTIPKDALFFALRGENTDGHLFISDAFRNGAAGVVVEHPIDPPARGFLVLQVPDSMAALHQLAAAARNAQQGTFIGLTGSCGKTSTKEFTAALLSEKYRVYKSEGNLNSLTGLPLSLLALGEETDCNVFELGMNNPGEIAQLCKILRPDIGMVLNVNPVHLGQFPSLEAIADEKFSLLSTMPSDALGVTNADDPLLAKRVPALKQKSFSFGFSDQADLRIADFQELGVRGSRGALNFGLRIADFGMKESIHFETQLCGAANAQNIAAATLCAVLAGVPPGQLSAAIGKLQPYKQRGRLILHQGISIYDDTYNSNPRALEYALRVIEISDGYKRKAAILGDMFELGPEERHFHEAAGMQVAAHHIDILIAAGEQSRFLVEEARKAGVPQVYWAENATAAGEKAKQVLRDGDLVLIKGSRGMKMEKALAALRGPASSRESSSGQAGPQT